MAEETPPTPIHTYHCLCTTLVLSTKHDLQTLPRRQEPVQDAALILAPPVDITRSDEIELGSAQTASSVMLNVAPQRKPVIIRREDGFERRTLLKCARCKLVLGYSLDEAHWANAEGRARPLYLLPGGLLSTAEMVGGKEPATPAWAEQK
ncbi:hypothetical protein G647_09506 [Cladophialophora carrionii CBS 160.54]|uniref:STEEP1 domain-containing protein n=1 Tax=Cladophialophora carrionii CBS 160.54 TaxID=1279043 RepID=V9DKS6_9EURO|nr:uncharacterized protein G647_09506 [Cladophialophora carrionii CBS 160.54]ETI27316.1 hypothetical protein G647_09506 [Cladophialophora carrionii CBS 160.54]